MIMNLPKLYKLELPLFMLLIVSGLWGPNLVNFTIGSLYIYPFRVLLPLLAFLFVLRNFKQNIKFPHIQVKGYMVFFIAWLAYGGLAIMWADHKDMGMLYWSILFQNILLIFFTVYYITNVKILNKLVFFTNIIMALTIIVGFWETTTGNHLSLSSYYNTIYEINRYIPTGTFFNPNDLGTYIAVFFPILLAWTLNTKLRILKLLSFILILLSLYILIKTESRANYVAVVIEIILWFLFSGRLKDRFFALVAIGVIGTIVAIGLVNINLDLLTFFQTQIFSLSNETVPDSLRLQLAQAGFKSFLNSWGMGLGTGNVNELIPFYMSSSQETMSLHNFWLEILFDYGVLIFIAFCAFYAQSLKQLFLIRFTQKQDYNQYAGSIFLSLVGTIIGGTSSSSLYGFIPFWVLLGLNIAVINIYRLDIVTSNDHFSADSIRKSQESYMPRRIINSLADSENKSKPLRWTDTFDKHK